VAKRVLVEEAKSRYVSKNVEREVRTTGVWQSLEETARRQHCAVKRDEEEARNVDHRKDQVRRQFPKERNSTEGFVTSRGGSLDTKGLP